MFVFTLMLWKSKDDNLFAVRKLSCYTILCIKRILSVYAIDIRKRVNTLFHIELELKRIPDLKSKVNVQCYPKLIKITSMRLHVVQRKTIFSVIKNDNLKILYSKSKYPSDPEVTNWKKTLFRNTHEFPDKQNDFKKGKRGKLFETQIEVYTHGQNFLPLSDNQSQSTYMGV